MSAADKPRQVIQAVRVESSTKVSSPIKIGESLQIMVSEGLQPIKQPGRYSVAGHLHDQTITNPYDADQKQLTFEDQLRELGLDRQPQNTDTEIIPANYIGINLSQGERLLMYALCEELQNNATTDNQSGETVLGNLAPAFHYLGGTRCSAPRLRIGFQELVRLAKGLPEGKNPGGKDLAEVEALLGKLRKREHVVSFEYKNKGDTRTTVREFLRLILQYREEETVDTAAKGTRAARKVIEITFNPIFQLGLQSHFYQFPTNWTRLKKEAWGADKIPNHYDLLCEVLIQKRTYTSKYEINEDKLIACLGLKSVRRKQGSKYVENLIREASEGLIRLGLLKAYTKEPNRTGGMKYVFEINQGFAGLSVPKPKEPRRIGENNRRS